MVSFNIYTEEIDVLAEAVEQIRVAFLEKEREIGGLRKNTAAIIFADGDTDIQELMDRLAEIYSFPMLASSTIVSFDGRHGHLDTGINMLVLTADDVEFSAAASGEIGDDGLGEEIRTAYAEAAGRLHEPPGLIIAYNVMLAPYTGDDVVSAFDAASGGVPLFGGQATGDFSTAEVFVAADRACRKHGAAMLLLAGSGLEKIHAVCEFAVTDERAFEGIVTGCRGCTISEVDEQPVLESLDSLGVTCGQDGVVQIQYITTPFLLTEEREDGGKVTMLRNLISIDRQAGTISLLGNVRKGSRISMVAAGRDRMADSVRHTIDMLLQEADAGKRRTVLCSSCLTRYMALRPRKLEELSRYWWENGGTLSVLGMYSAGEYFPQNFQGQGAVYNVFHNSAMAMLFFEE
ncbi:FIST C-terminal domain-containing protein [Anaerovibrio sp.]|uniref:FIST C-terminal domain-containing protein n=1 Tax=Anaerovibrio sp. TaxID=1872532 RepID=UPI003F1644CF